MPFWPGADQPFGCPADCNQLAEQPAGHEKSLNYDLGLLCHTYHYQESTLQENNWVL
jgi:hypothetical protein